MGSRDHLPTRPLDGVYPAQKGASTVVEPGQQIATSIKLEKRCENPEALGVTFSIAGVGKLTANECERISSLILLPRARIWFGIGDARQFVDLDLRTGATLSVLAESLEVLLDYQVRTPPWAVDGCDLSCAPSYRVLTSVGYGGSCRLATFTEVAFVEEPGARCRIPIPPFASTFTVLPNQDSSVKIHIRAFSNQYDVRDVIVAPLSNLGQSNRVDQIPIPNGARWIEVENTSETLAATAFVVFGLGI